MTRYELTVTFPGVIDGVVQQTPCTHCRGTLGFKRHEKGHTYTYTQLIAQCYRCMKEQSIEAMCTLVRR